MLGKETKRQSPKTIPKPWEPFIFLKIDQTIKTGKNQKMALAGIHKKSLRPLKKLISVIAQLPSHLVSKMFRKAKINPPATKIGIRGIKISFKCVIKRFTFDWC